MTKKDYVAVSNVLRAFRKMNPKRTKSGQKEFEILVDGFCLMFQSDNPRFSKEKFKNAVMEE